MVEPLFRTKAKEGDKAIAVHVFTDHIMLIRMGRGKGPSNRPIPLVHVFSVTQRKSSIGVSTVSINTAGNPVEIQCSHKDAGLLCGAATRLLAQQRAPQPLPVAVPGPTGVPPRPMAALAPPSNRPAPAPLPPMPSLTAAPPPPALAGPPEPTPCALCNAPATHVRDGACTFCGQREVVSGGGPASPPPGWWIASDGRWYPPQGSV